jgi:predicted HicB family RNase H-like nuclease
MATQKKSSGKEPDRVQVNVRLPEDLRKQVKFKAVLEDTSLQDIIEGLLRAWVDGKAKPLP